MTQFRGTLSRTAVAIVVVVVVLGMAFGAGLAASTPSDTATQDVSTLEQGQTAQTGILDQLMGEDGITRTGGNIIYTAPAGESFGVTNLTVEDADSGMLSVTADVSNANDWLAVQHVEVRVDGEVVDRRPFALDPSATESIEFMIDSSEWSDEDHVVSVLTYDHGAVTTVSSTGPVEPANASVTFDDQISDGMTVTVTEVTVPDGGFVVIHETASLAEGDAVGSTIGVSEYLSAGTHENVTVTLFDVPGAETNATMLENDTELTAMPHLDTNDNQTYEFVSSSGADDGPYVVDGAAVVDDAMITIETPSPTTEEPVNETTTEEPTNETTTEEPTNETTTEGPTNETTTEEPTNET